MKDELSGTYMMTGAVGEPREVRNRRRKKLYRWLFRASHLASSIVDKRLDLAVRVAKEDEQLGNWPRRLLHVPTMTSYKWRAGNYYGSKKSPRYNAITYTWGRWALRDGDMAHVQAVGIKGVPWKIPRVSPSHFARDDFLAVIRRATGDLAMTIAGGSRLNSQNDAIEFVWLDVACIDQRIWEPASAAEVSRQAKIFSGASTVYIWPTRLTDPELQALENTTRQLTEKFATVGSDGPSNLDMDLTEAYAALQKLMADPWFSSLWTLQEAFLLRMGVFLPKTGEGEEAPWSKDSVQFELQQLTRLSNVLDRCRKRASSNPTSTVPEILTECLRLMEQVGISSIATGNGIAALAASEGRTAGKAEDRVYGIQQIFGFRLGITAQGAHPGASFAREELDLQFRHALISSFPLLSQLHVFTEPVAFGDGWRVNASSVARESSWYTPLMPLDLFSQTSHYMESRCSLSARDFRGRTWGHFAGMVCSYEKLATKALQIMEDPLLTQDPAYAQNAARISILDTHLDVSSLILASPEYRGNGLHLVPSGDRQRALGRWLLSSFPMQDVAILLLGPCNAEYKNYGLLLLRQHDDIGQAESQISSDELWRRMGYCEWWCERQSPMEPWPSFHAFDTEKEDDAFLFPGWVSLEDMRLFEGESEDWIETSGFFG